MCSAWRVILLLRIKHGRNSCSVNTIVYARPDGHAHTIKQHTKKHPPLTTPYAATTLCRTSSPHSRGATLALMPVYRSAYSPPTLPPTLPPPVDSPLYSVACLHFPLPPLVRPSPRPPETRSWPCANAVGGEPHSAHRAVRATRRALIGPPCVRCPRGRVAVAHAAVPAGPDGARRELACIVVVLHSVTCGQGIYRGR